ncbi:MAG: chemotaxis protein, partial [Alphaproteobacteria bacterium]|nr:chemotaxis protein [Alphaproteobacteria bacterium]
MPERVLSLSKQLADTANNKVGEIRHVTKSMKMLALNAQIEAVRAGEAGRGFTIVAQEVKSISERITGISDQLTESLTEQTEELNALGQGLVNSIRGQRLTDLALNMIEIMDRNLYERSCDVRWWATDSAVVQALSHPNRETQEYASKRLGVILGAYTVYLDLWIVNTQGQVIANGRPSLYPRALGMNVSQENWFRQAMATASGDDFSVADVQANAALDNRP